MPQTPLKIVIYSKAACPACVMAKSIFEKKGAAYEEILLDSRPQDIQSLTERTGVKTVPQIFINGEFIGGCSDLMALDKNGQLDPLLQM